MRDIYKFGIKCIIVTICLYILIGSFFPKYEFPDTHHRCNRATGVVESFSTASYNRGWGSL